MSPGIALSLHWWRGIGPDIQRDFFVWRYRLGFATVVLERNDPLEAYRKLRRAIEDAILKDYEGR